MRVLSRKIESLNPIWVIQGSLVSKQNTKQISYTQQMGSWDFPGWSTWPFPPGFHFCLRGCSFDLWLRSGHHCLPSIDLSRKNTWAALGGGAWGASWELSLQVCRSSVRAAGQGWQSHRCQGPRILETEIISRKGLLVQPSCAWRLKGPGR